MPPYPMGTFTDDNSHLGVKLALLAVPKAFKREHNDIVPFLGDCQVYFEVFASYFRLASQMIPFATSHLDGPAKKWWVHHQQQYWSNDDRDNLPPQFRYPTWREFGCILHNRFRDPAIEDVHE
ncbi:hypothetical protein ARMSODRAFT_1011241 [Armillaria solidipes]|uniref:DUF4939 domain-containing protein n=1 Tax=Armillaria solidipes TaxID=1076256 RepID=A0A2H3C6J9_9AGAR|nr:hypothetical protein ARMSODRAFT_1011241 [Armillaria solidipes]